MLSSATMAMSSRANPVYVADQDAAVRDSIELLLQTQRHAVRQFDSGQSLLDTTLIEPPGCIVMDAIMSDMDGPTLLRRISEHQMPTPVILLGGNSKIASVVDAIKAGAWDYFEKPFLQHALLESVLRALDNSFRK